MKFEVKNRFSGEVQFTAEIECAEDVHISIKLGLAAQWAVETRANLADADLAGANLAGANLAGANLAGANLAGSYLARAYLARADLARANLADADLADANLADANLADADLAGANLAGANLAGANLAGANLARADLAGANLADANLADADLAGANLAGANLAGANLAGANLARADLAGANLADALKIDEADIPIVPNIDATILKAIEAGGKLDMGQWHGDEACGTTHCRAGWAVHLAGEKGYDLEKRVGPQMAGTLIYHASRPGKPTPHFFSTNERALEDLRKCAAEEAQP
jgi:hypothetical protein